MTVPELTDTNTETIGFCRAILKYSDNRLSATVTKAGYGDCMEITQVADVLTPEGLGAPTLNALVPNEDNYTVLLMQPKGSIEASAAGVRNRDRSLALRQFGKFLDDARETQADLVVTPEYSMPWDTLVDAIKAGAVPAQGKLWTLGCESIKYSELETLKQNLAPSATVLFEKLQPDDARFTDPLAYVFLAPTGQGHGAARIVVLVQFKTYPMGHPKHFETNAMQRGTRIYQFGDTGHRLRLVSLICADAFEFKDGDAEMIYDRALILHIQMNQDPRHVWFHGCRERLLRYNGDETEVLCLNWAEDVHVWCGGSEKPWHNIAGSAWYLKATEFDHEDTTLCKNHRQGLYYTWLQVHRTHALFFNFKPATYLLNATKVAHIGVPGAISRRRGPQLTKTCVWNDTASAWEEGTLEDGFSNILCESGPAKDDIKRIAEGNPFEAERVLALCAGEIRRREDWHEVQFLDSCVINASEVIRRITFAQDTHEEAKGFRIARLKRCGHLWDILKRHDLLPPALADLKDGFRFGWSPDFPHQNAISATGHRATVIYMGEDTSDTDIEDTAKTVAEYLHRKSANPDDSRVARQRLAVWYRDNDGIALYDSHRYVRIDQTGDASEFDIGRER